MVRKTICSWKDIDVVWKTNGSWKDPISFFFFLTTSKAFVSKFILTFPTLNGSFQLITPKLKSFQFNDFSK